ncbi:MAG: polyprenyl diphosphate synthase [Candidatus Saccharimonadales bacterium]
MSNNLSESGTPNHLGLILDGNRRWAKENGLTVSQGHRKGYQNLKTITKAAIKLGVRYVSAYVFSTENWNRDKQEVQDLMKLLSWVLKYEVKKLDRENIRVRVIGSKLTLGTAMLRAIHHAEEQTKNNTRGTLLLCLDYGGQQEIVDAIKRIAEVGVDPDDITPEIVGKFLYAPDIPPVDLIIRTSGEQRLSNFMMWESAYSELIFESKYWPDYTEKDLKLAMERYGTLKRRFGK